MLFPTVTFAVFFVAAYAVHLLVRSRPRVWKVAMVVASYIFYGWWDWRFCALLGGSTLVNWALARGVSPARGEHQDRLRRAMLGVAVAANVAVLGLFKYYGFLVESASAAFGSSTALPALEVVLPVGISFFTFQAMSYTIDVYRGRLDDHPLLDVAVYLSFFPQLVAGPIVRATEFLPQLDHVPERRPVDASEAAWLIARGLFKKVVVATYLASVVDPVFAAPSLASRGELLVAFYAYAIQIYADFSGYTDIAIGIALLLGFRFPVNFDNPYRARSVQDFWRRWHMTLSRWLRDYLYIPLGGSQGSRFATYRNLMLTMVLGGLWHGAAWTFVVWGGIHGLALSVERAIGELNPEARSAPSWLRPVAQWAITFHVVCVAWVLFRAETFGLAKDFLVGLLTAPLAGPINTTAVALILAALVAQFGAENLRLYLRRLYAQLDPAIQSATIGAWLFLVAALGPEGVAPFIYFQF